MSDSDCSEWVCPWEGCERAFDTEHAMKTHHGRVHGESIAGVDTPCAWCGEMTTVQRSRYEEFENSFCSTSCMGKWKSENIRGGDHPLRKRVTCKCEWCGSEYDVKAYREEASRFCSVDCRLEWQSELFSSEDNPRWKPKVELACEVCEETYDVVPSRADKSRCCSYPCRNEWLSEVQSGENHYAWEGGVPTHTCEYCGGEFKGYNKAAKAMRFCSIDCYSTWVKENWTGPDSPNWKGGRFPYGEGWNERKRELVRDRDGRQCRICGQSEEDHLTSCGKKHIVHHIKDARSLQDVPGTVRNDPLNLVTICEEHHGVLGTIPAKIQFTLFLPHPEIPIKQSSLRKFQPAD